ncbi:MAG TPA: class I SAM-dependent methyltransferase [Burkholderiaceae bacterium]|nr:class I SAM-dependent methyltransferase [Burkholderiaceae bacterium]
MPALRLTWPLPALLAWALGWAVFALLRSLGAPLALAIAVPIALGAALSALGTTPWRRVFVAAGFPLSLLASGLAGAMPAWGWLLPLALLALVYPLNAWHDAPLFPTPAGALDGLARLAPLAPNARVLDAGCGLGAGLRELHREYPAAATHGLEWSWPLRIACAWGCRFATVRRGDIWAADWSGYDLVYVFQRPESMDRAAAKATRELRPGAWLVSLEFDAPGFAPTKVIECADGRRLWLYRVPFRTRPALS